MSQEAAAATPAAGRVVRPAKNGKTQVIRSRRRWSDTVETKFLTVLAATCNVTAAADAVGFSTTAVYNRRMRWPGFAGAWAEAVEQGYARLEAQLVEEATDSLRTAPVEGGAEGPKVSFSDRLNLLRLHRAEVRGGAPQGFAHRRQPPDLDEVRAGILRKIEAIARAEARAEAREVVGGEPAGGAAPA